MIVKIKKIYHHIRAGTRLLKIGYWQILNLAYKLGLLTIYDIPIIINNFNRLTSLIKLIEFLEMCGFRNIIILDNDSSYPPLLEFYQNSKYQVMRDGHNYGHLALWKSGLYNRVKLNYFVYTDSDVVPIDECPKNFIEYFKGILDKKQQLDKIGFGIKIDDLPDSFYLKNEVINYEWNYWQNEVMPNIYKAPIDTTFALYKPLSKLKFDQAHTLSAYRIGFPYLIRHLPWYIDFENLSVEEKYYLETSNNSSSIARQWKGGGKIY